VKYILIFLLLLAFNSSANSNDEANANRLFVTILNSESEIFKAFEEGLSPKKMSNNELKTSISSIENITKVLQNIVESYPGSSLAVQLVTGQRVGSFSPNDLYAKFVEMKLEYQVRKCSLVYERQCMFDLINAVGLKNKSVQDTSNYNAILAQLYFHFEYFDKAAEIIKDIDFQYLNKRDVEGIAIFSAMFLSQHKGEEILGKLPKSSYRQKGYHALLKRLKGGDFKTTQADVYGIMQGFDPRKHRSEDSYFRMMANAALLMKNLEDAIYYIQKIEKAEIRNELLGQLAAFYAERGRFKEALLIVQDLKAGSYWRQSVVSTYAGSKSAQKLPNNMTKIIVEDAMLAISNNTEWLRWKWVEILEKFPVNDTFFKLKEDLEEGMSPSYGRAINIFIPIGRVPKYNEGDSKIDYVAMIESRVLSNDSNFSDAEKSLAMTELCFIIKSDECALRYLEQMLQNLSLYSDWKEVHYARGYVMANILDQKELQQRFLEGSLSNALKQKRSFDSVRMIGVFMRFIEQGELFR